MHFDFTNVWNTLIVFSSIFKGTLENGFKGVLGGGWGFLAQWATAKLHRFTVTCFFSLFLSSFWFLFLMVLVLFLLSAGFPSLLRHQTWALLRSVERALGSINRITGVARAGVYGVCLHWPGPGEGWATVHWDFLLRSLLLLPFLPLLFPTPHAPPSVCPARLSWPLSFLQPRPAGLSLGSHYLIFTSCLGRRVLTAHARVFVWMVSARMCPWRSISGSRGFRCRMYSTISLTEIGQKS